ncbi:UDP-N-acetylglucosamine 1-carboxyvinyltransferase [Oscillibacter sp. PC13]|uniref:UDP-N-acetylglucosamine 1-carboxyvinyltransferase n=1 Tax=Oscillibacter sp. PC13 TaxID=1855299 RepID=UPI0008EB5578|nr:UDP-N-acetylglucosamine 1-carboxyvinyltransferase [Oscillibacter sp. PC13]SFP21510.1 UDP-N-acetylglucosamine 1-carboxyvinyltransferase [Oscillibacter sp. PC13]
MSQLLVRGGGCLRGSVTVQGAKNSVLPILAATLLARGQVVLEGCPHLRDVDASIRILRYLGCEAQWEGSTLIVDTAALKRCEISDILMREMRSSAIFLGAILARCGRADLSYPGGCELGPRPIDLHLSGLRDLGAEITDEGGVLHCRAAELRGREILLSLPSVGATENLMLAACGASETTVISNAAREPEIVDLQNFLNACGAKVSGAGSSAITVEGGQSLHGCVYGCMPDRIVAATYLCAAASAGGEIFLRGAEERHLAPVTAVLREAGCTIVSDSSGILCASRKRLRAVRTVRTAPYPGFPTDAQAILMAALLRSRGATVFEENIFENRYRHVDELVRMGAEIQVSGRVAVVTGVETLHGAPVRCTDLRGGAALCVAALAAEGDTHISEIGHIDRGYQDIARDLQALGADIARVESPENSNPDRRQR